MMRFGKEVLQLVQRRALVAVAIAGAVGAVFSLGAALAGCKKSKKATAEQAKAGQGSKKNGWYQSGEFYVKLPDEKGTYVYKGKFPKRYPCKTDADCVLTHLIPGQCCPDQCEAHAANKSWMAALRHLHYPTCRDWRKKHGFATCGRPKCPPPKGIPKARCVDNRCVVAYRPIVPKVKFKTVSPPRLTAPPVKPGAGAKGGEAGAVPKKKGGADKGGEGARAPGGAEPAARPRPAEHHRVQ